MNKPLALIIDDEPDIRELLAITLNRMDLECYCARNLAEAHQLLEQYKFNICLTDMRLPDGDGVDFVGYTQQHFPDLPIAVITAHGNMETAIQALKSGAYDFLTKPVDLASLRTLVASALRLSKGSRHSERELTGCSQATEEIRRSIEKLARSQAPIYISGESGTGKELVARMIHEQSTRSDFPFVPVNCGAIPHELMESEFFGHVKGSFTGAVSSKEGLFSAAKGGTLFFDEIAELPQHLQVKLLRVIQEKSFRPVGATKEIATDVRILSATHNSLGEMVKEGRFRQDLFYRINVIELHIPPLRERPEDISLLCDHILGNLAAENNRRKSRLDKEALDALASYSFPGNVRELENILHRAITLAEGEIISVADLQLPGNIADAGKTQVNDKIRDNRKTALDSYLGDVERQTILETLEKTRWNKTAAAKQLGITLRALRYRLEKLGLD